MTSIRNDDVMVVECKEYERVDIPSSLWVSSEHRAIFNSEIDGKDVLRASFQNGQIRLQATSFVGIIPVNDQLVVRVRPRVPLSNLTRMVLDTGHDVLALATLTRDYRGRGPADDWAMDIYTDSLLERADEVVNAGLLRRYVDRDGEGYVPRGRVGITRTIQRFAARGVPNKSVSHWSERTTDTAVNRLVKAALEVAHAHLSKDRTRPRKGDRAKLARLAGLLRVFDEVHEDADRNFLDDLQVLGIEPLPDARSYYWPLINLCRLILKDQGIALEITESGDVQLDSLLIDTNRLFENFARVSLARYAAAMEWPVDVLDGNGDGHVDLYDTPDPLPSPLGRPMAALAAGDRGRAQPDVVFRALDGRHLLVAEAKNTVHALTSTLPERGEVEQAITYALRYGLNFTVLIHPWVRGEKGLIYVGRISSIDVYDFRLDLSENEHIDDRLAEMAESFAALLGWVSPAA